MGPELKEFARRVSRYFLDFLETDFKRQQAPRRKVQLTNDMGFRTGVPLRKYPTLYQFVWAFAAQPVGSGLTLTIPRGRYTARISPILHNLICQHVDSVTSAAFAQACAATLEHARRTRGHATENPERYVEEVQATFAEQVDRLIIAPVLGLLDGHVRQQAYSAVESVFEVEADLIEVLTAPAIGQLPTALNTFVVNGDLAPTEKVLTDFFAEKDAKERLIAFFDDFATADAYQELRDLVNYLRTADNLQLYLYLCDVRYGAATYPLFYLPATVTLEEHSSAFTLQFDPHLLVNKRAIDYICQEEQARAGRLVLSPVQDRIQFLDEKVSLVDEIERILRVLIPALDLAGDLDVRAPRPQILTGTTLRLGNAAYFAAFDKSDEALLNDYEELLIALNTDQQSVTDLFERIIRSLILDNPVPVTKEVWDRWDELPVPERLVAESPIPLNEEQRKILDALRGPNCRYLAIQGPPGTGKSHTITAIAFDCILNRRNVLILSDKQEALDVVEDKLKQTLAEVRLGDDFPDPILRLGRAGGSYTRLLAQNAQGRIRDYYRAARANAETLVSETRQRSEGLKKNIGQTVAAYTAVKLPDIEELHRLEAEIDRQAPGLTRHLQEPRQPALLGELDTTAAALVPDSAPACAYLARRFPKGSLADLLFTVRIHATAHKLGALRRHREALVLFTALGPAHQRTLQSFIAEYEALRMPVLGFLFRGARARAINGRVGEVLPCPNPLNLHKRLPALRTVNEALVTLRRALPQASLAEEHGERVYEVLITEQEPTPDLPALCRFLDLYERVLGPVGDPPHAALTIDGIRFRHVTDLLIFLAKAVRYVCLWQKIRRSLEAAPQFDYVGEKTQLERLYTSRMATEIDGRFVDFVENERTTARALAGVIKAKQRFPQDTFESFKRAFPCIIASIREFAEYVPLRQDLFDVVVIDEASQVSVAQAFPALLRASKVVVFGDHKQFSNVKAANASNLRNQTYLTEIDRYFQERISRAADRIQRLKQFDVKKSVLEFFDLIANYADMLRKHFRGYQELISFSSAAFYDHQLQAIKVRGKPIDEVIQFTEVKPAGRKERYRNVNSAEAEFIRDHLRKLVDEEAGLTVGVITPFREQQQYLTRLLFEDGYAERFEQDLRLKVMTFDTCQGEERDLILYSMVATPTHDVLNYVFPVSLEAAREHVEEALKAQRLNVGFSRAKETIHFVISKPVDQFHGSIGRALAHYQNILENPAVSDASATDPRSAMEPKVLDWIQKTPFFQRHQKHLELIPQFRVGDYLRQLDPTYTHPRYRCDFLLRFEAGDRPVNIIIEYDGFKEHFTDHGTIHAANYAYYFRPQDVERQMTLESYGYKFLRINRFNLGRDPVATLSERLFALIKELTDGEEPPILTHIRTEAEGLANGTAQHCRRCGQVKPKQAFRDSRLRSGYGQICLECKRAAGRASRGGQQRIFGHMRI